MEQHTSCSYEPINLTLTTFMHNLIQNVSRQSHHCAATYRTKTSNGSKLIKICGVWLSSYLCDNAGICFDDLDASNICSMLNRIVEKPFHPQTTVQLISTGSVTVTSIAKCSRKNTSVIVLKTLTCRFRLVCYFGYCFSIGNFLRAINMHSLPVHIFTSDGFPSIWSPRWIKLLKVVS